MNKDINNLVIIGSGPSGLTCGIYAARADLKPIVIAGNNPGGQLMNTDKIENFPGFKSISGPDFMMQIIEQSESLGIQFEYENVSSIKKEDNLFYINLESGKQIISRTVLIATGAKHRHLNVKGEEEFINKGVSWCATCDGPLYKDKITAVIGGGNTAVMEALFLSGFSKKVYLVHRRDKLRADNVLQEKLFAKKNIECIWNSKIISIEGSKNVESIVIQNSQNDEINIINVDGIFIAIGTEPSSEFIRDIVETDSMGYIKTNNTKTSVDGIFAAGDVVSGSLKQAIYAAGQGALASKEIEEYLR